MMLRMGKKHKLSDLWGRTLRQIKMFFHLSAGRIYDQNFFPQLGCLPDAFFRCLIISDDQIQMIQGDAVADGADIPFGIIQQQDPAAGDGSQGPLGGGHGL